MRVWYFVKRGYFSGKSTVVIKREHPRNVPRLFLKLLKAWFQEVPRRLRTGGSGSEHPVLALQWGALLAGKIAQHIENVVGHLGTETVELIKRHGLTARVRRPGVGLRAPGVDSGSGHGARNEVALHATPTATAARDAAGSSSPRAARLFADHHAQALDATLATALRLRGSEVRGVAR